MSEISNNQVAQKVDGLTVTVNDLVVTVNTLATSVEHLARATNEGFKEIREEMTDMKSELRTEMQEMKTDLRAEMKDMKAELVDLFNRKDEQNKEDIRHLYTITGRLS